MTIEEILAELRAEVERNRTVDGSAIALLNGISGRIDAAVAAALANVATAEQLAPITDEIAAIRSSTDALAAAVEANTPGA